MYRNFEIKAKKKNSTTKLMWNFLFPCQSLYDAAEGAFCTRGNPTKHPDEVSPVQHSKRPPCNLLAWLTEGPEVTWKKTASPQPRDCESELLQSLCNIQESSYIEDVRYVFVVPYDLFLLKSEVLVSMFLLSIEWWWGRPVHIKWSCLENGRYLPLNSKQKPN